MEFELVPCWHCIATARFDPASVYMYLVSFLETTNVDYKRHLKLHIPNKTSCAQDCWTSCIPFENFEE